MREFWTIPIVNITYTRSQNCTNMVIGEHGIQTFKVVGVVMLFLLLSINIFVPTSAHLILCLGKWLLKYT